MSAAPASRVNYFDRQFIRVAELQDEQSYHVQLRRRHNLSHHSWGIVLGLEIVREQDGRPAVRPGLAIDGYGRELVLDRRVIGRDVFDRYGTTRLDLWLEYQVDLADDRLAPVECGGGDPRQRYRAVERAQLVFTRGGARPDPRRPPGVPPEALEEPLLATPDDPGQRWPVYLGRIIMVLADTGEARFEIDTADRVYVGLNAEIIDHPGNATRLELGRRPANDDTRRVGDDEFQYDAGSTRDFAVFVPGTNPLQPTIGVYSTGTEIIGGAAVHGNLILDGASLKFASPINGPTPDADNHPALYRAHGAMGEELRIDMGAIADADRRLVLGMSKDGEFQPALEISYPTRNTSSTPSPYVRIFGDLRIEGTIKSTDVRTRTVTEEVAALLAGMVQAGQASGSS